MKRSIGWIVLIGMLLVQGEAQPTDHGTFSGERSFRVTYTVHIADLPSNGQEAKIWVPLAKTRGNQHILSRRIQTPYPYQISQEHAYGNDILYLHLTAPLPDSLELAVDYDAIVRGGRLPDHHLAAPATSSEEISLNLRDEPLMVVDEAIRHLALEATAGRTTDRDRARALYEYVIAHMSYDKTTPGWGRGDTLRACALRKGNCTDFHSLFISMARSLGIPARFVIGTTVPDGAEGESSGYHCWAEFYSPDDGWVPVDASEAWKHPDLREAYFGSLDPNKFLISAGRNLRLVPAQEGGPVNIFLNPYVEVDGRSSGSVELRFHFRNRQHKEVST